MQKQKQNTNLYSSDIKKNENGRSGRLWKFTGRLTVLLIIILGVSYIVSINSLSVKGFVLQELKNKTRQLETESNNIELNIMSMETNENIDQRAKSMKMVKIDKVDYVLAGTVGVAKK